MFLQFKLSIAYFSVEVLTSVLMHSCGLIKFSCLYWTVSNNKPNRYFCIPIVNFWRKICNCSWFVSTIIFFFFGGCSSLFEYLIVFANINTGGKQKVLFHQSLRGSSLSDLYLSLSDPHRRQLGGGLFNLLKKTLGLHPLEKGSPLASFAGGNN